MSLPRALDRAPTESPLPDTPLLFADRGCPFAHRVLALLDHLERPIELREAAVGDKPAEIGRYSASRRIPLLVHGDLVITESRVMLEHLAEHHGFEDALPPGLVGRTLHRHGMSVVDRFIVPLLMPDDAEVDGALLEEALGTLEQGVADAMPGPSLLAFHVAPFWLRFRWLDPKGPVVRAVEAHPTLRTWLDAVIQLPSLQRTAPDRIAHLADFARVQHMMRNT